MKPTHNKDIEERIYKWITKLLNEHITLNLSPLAKFTQARHLMLLVLAALDNTSAEAIAKDKLCLPSADTVLGAIRKLHWTDVRSGFDRILDVTMIQLRKQRMLWGSVILAIDFHDVAESQRLSDTCLNSKGIQPHDRYYGEKDDEGVVGTKPERGTCYAFRIATIDIVMRGFRFTLAVMPFRKDMSNADIVEYLIGCVERHMKIQGVLLDGGFYGVDVIKRLEKLNVKYVIRADKSKRLNKRLKRANKEKGYKSPWTVNKGAETTLVAVYDKKKNSEKEEWHAWVTNIDASPKKIGDIYKRRWGIETGYRVKGDFQANTCSKNFTVRIMYSLLAICLYNLWVLINLLYDFEIIKMAVANCKKYKPSVTTRMVRKSYERLLLTMCEGV